MKRDKSGILFAIILVVTLMWSMTSIAAERKYQIKFAHQSPPKEFESPAHAMAVGFKYQIEKQSGGQFQVDIYASGTLGGEVDVLEALKSNVIQISLTSAAGFHRVFPPALLFYTPYIFRTPEIAMDVTKGPFGQKLANAFTEKTGLKVLMIAGSYTYMTITNNKRPIRTPDDMKGIKFRVMDPIGGQMFKAFDAGAIPIAWAEVYTSLQTGVVDGQTNPTYVIDNDKIYEVQKYLTLANSQWGYTLLLCNKQWYDSLNKKELQLVKNAVTAAEYSGSGISLLLENTMLKKLKKNGMQVSALSETEISRFQAVAKDKSLDWMGKWVGQGWVDDLKVAIAESEAKFGYR